MLDNVEKKAGKTPRRVFWELMLIGVVLFIAGIFTLVYPQVTLKFILIILGIVSIISSVGFLMRFLRIKDDAGWASSFVLVLAGLLFIFGIILIIKPDETWNLLIYLVGLWFAAYAVYSIIASVKIKAFSQEMFVVTLVLGLLLLITGVLLILSPSIGITFVGTLIGISLVINGLEFSILAIVDKLNDRQKRE